MTDRQEMMINTPLSIAVIEPSGNLYGSEFCLLDILTGLPPEAYQPVVFLPKGGAFASHLERNQVPYRPILVPRAHTAGRVPKGMAYLRLFLSLLYSRPDLLYINQAGILRPMVFMNRFLRQPILCQVQTLEDAEWVSQNPATHSFVNTFVCNSDFIAAHTSVPEDRKCTVYYGYRLKHLRRERPEFDPARIIVGLLGRIGGSKGHDLVLKAAEMMKNTGETRFQFRFIGEAPTHEEGVWWRKEVERRQLASMIEFRGYREDIAEELADLHVMVIPSRREPFGRILCEAAEAEVPVIVSNSGGLGELSHTFHIGLTHTAEDASDLVRALKAAADDYDDFRKKFHMAAKRFLNALDYQDYIRHMETILDSASRRRNTTTSWHGKKDL